MILVLVRTIVIYILLNIMLKIMGKRQIGELEVNELVSTLLISEIASAPITDVNIPILSAIVPIVLICTLEIIVAYVKNKSELIKRAIEGKSLYIIYKGRVIQRVLDENRISINELLTEMRIQGIGDISEVEYGLLEQNGKISLLKKQDNNAQVLVADGRVDSEALVRLNMSEDEVLRYISDRGLSLGEVFLLTVDDKGKYNLLVKEGKK
nr:DUF421 domain-containing protein [Clostridia bacterium]